MGLTDDDQGSCAGGGSQRLHRRIALLAAMEQASLDAIVTIDAQGIVLSFNPAAERLFGYSEVEVVGKNVSILMPAHLRAEHDGHIRRYLDTGEKRIIGIGRVVAGEKKDGSVFPLELSVGEARTGEAPVFVGFIRDLSQIESQQRRVQELQLELFHASRLNEMEKLASSLAHEISQPLAAIINYVQALQQRLGHNADVVTDIPERIEAQAQRAAEIVKRLRGFVDGHEGVRRFEDLRNVIEEALALALVGPASAAVRVRLDLERKLGDVEIDRVQIQQVLVNLLRNAVEAMDRAPYRQVSLTCARDTCGFVRISVSDTGPGLAPDIAPRLFEAFATTKANGMGVGLSICKTIVENHGGRIWYEPNEKGGATFHFTLPAGSV